MEANSFLGADVDLGDLAMRTKNFSGAEIEGLVKSATSFALNRQVDVSDLSKPINEDNLKARPRSSGACRACAPTGPEQHVLHVALPAAACWSAHALAPHGLAHTVLDALPSPRSVSNHVLQYLNKEVALTLNILK